MKAWIKNACFAAGLIFSFVHFSCGNGNPQSKPSQNTPTMNASLETITFGAGCFGA